MRARPVYVGGIRIVEDLFLVREVRIGSVGRLVLGLGLGSGIPDVLLNRG